jgi:elongation factor G
VIPEKIRNVALVGHGGSGKTSLAEALLYVSGATSRLGSVDTGTSILDHTAEEQERKISLELATAVVDWHGHRINLIDTPGYADFAGDARAALRAADLALFVVSAVDGVEVGTETHVAGCGRGGHSAGHHRHQAGPRARQLRPHALANCARHSASELLRSRSPSGRRATCRGLARVVSGRCYGYAERGRVRKSDRHSRRSGRGHLGRPYRR